VAFASLARERVCPPGDVLLALTADEEVGVDYGMSWLATAHSDAVRAAFALNEGGGERCVLGGRVYYLCCVGEKATAPFKLRLRGRSGHASDPHTADNALLKAGPVLEALARLEPPRTLVPEVSAFLETVLGDAPPVEVALERAKALHPLAGELVAPLLSATLSPTMIEASRKRNVVPGSCVIEVDCRLLPGQEPAEIEALLRAGVPGDWEIEWIVAEHVGGTRSPLDTALWRALQSWVDRLEPGARLAPIVLAGFTDSHYVRSAFGTTAYGFFPLGRWSRTMPRASSTPPTSGSRSTISTQASTCSATSRRRSTSMRSPRALPGSSALPRRRAGASSDGCSCRGCPPLVAGTRRTGAGAPWRRASIPGGRTDPSERRRSGRVRRLPERDLHGGAQDALPELPTDLTRLEALAAERLPPTSFAYVRARPVRSRPARANRAAFEAWRLVPRMLRDVTDVRHVGSPCSAPRCPRRSRSRPSASSRSSTRTASRLRRAQQRASACRWSSARRPRPRSRTSPRRPDDGPRWYQLYWPKDRELAASFLERAAAARYRALVVTLDTHALGWRPRDLDGAFLPFLKGVGNQNYFADPVFVRARSAGRSTPTASVRRCSDGRRSSPDPTLTWDDPRVAARALGRADRAEGIQHPDDARRAVDAGMDGVVVSNHGGRQVDGAIASLDALPAIAEAVGDRVDVLFDSGVRTGAGRRQGSGARRARRAHRATVRLRPRPGR
jgi:L-lactate dehydrogenase (cytochrome)